MDLLEAFVKQIGGSTGMDSAEHQGMLGEVMKVVSSPQVGGLGGLVQGFEKAGLGNLVQSWVSSGSNQQATPRQIEQGMGSDLIGSLAKRLNLSPAMASMVLSVLLPIIVDKLTPKGQMPPKQQSSDLGALLQGLGGLLGGR